MKRDDVTNETVVKVFGVIVLLLVGLKAASVLTHPWAVALVMVVVCFMVMAVVVYESRNQR